MLEQPSVAIFLALAFGILCGDALQPAWGWLAALTVAGFCGLTVALRRQRGTLLCALTIVALAGAWRSMAVPLPPAAAVHDPEGAIWRVQVDAPINRQIDDRGVHLTTQAQLLAEQVQNHWQPRQGRVRLRLQPGDAVVRGDVLELRLQVRPLRLPHNPTDVAVALVQRRQQVGNAARVLSQHALVAQGTGPWAWIDAIRRRASEALERDLSSDLAGLAKALALGDQSAIALPQREAWADAGVAHLLSVSGLHVSLVALVLAWVARRLLGFWPAAGERFSARRWAALLALPGVLGYCVLTGMSPPAVRSAVMTSAALLGLVLGHPSGAGNAWGVAGCGMLLADPWALYDPGFLLSFGAVAALVWWAPKPAPVQGWYGKARQFVVHGLAVSAAASFVTAPITAYFFGRVSWAAPLVNLLAVPVGSAVATPLALAHAGVGAWWPQAGAWLAMPLGWALGAVDGLSAWVSASGWASFDMPQPTLLQWALHGAILLAWLGHRRRWALACTLTLAVTVLWPFHPQDDVRVHQVYVGQGDATVVQLPHGGTVLVDGGGGILDGDRDPGQMMLAPVLRRLGVRRLDLLVLTHPHPDHVNGLLYVAQRWPVGELWWNGTGAEVPAVQALQAAVRQRGGRVVASRDVPFETVRDGVRLQLWHPHGPGGGAYPRWHANDNSIVLRLQYGARSMLLAGDVERPAETLLARAGVPPTDILKVPHHGSRTSSSWDLLDALQPWAAGISCGEDNHFGFPHPEVLARYAAAGVPVWRTDVDGMLTWRTDGQQWWVRSGTS